MKQQKDNWVKILFSFAAPCKGKMALSVFCAILSVAGGFIPFWAVYEILLAFINQNVTLNGILIWCLVGAAGYLLRVACHGISTILAHISAYTILEGIRLKIADRLMKAPLGEVMGRRIGYLKNIIMDKVEDLEPPLAHMIPELTSNLLLPVAIFTWMMVIDWRMGLAVLIAPVLAMIPMFFLMRNYNSQYAAYMEANNHVNSIIIEYVEGIEVVKAFNQSTSSYEKFVNAVQSFKEFTLAWFKSTWKTMNLMMAIMPTTLLGVLPVGLLLVQNGSISPAELAMGIILSLSIVGPLMKATTFINEAKSMEYAVEAANELLNLPMLPDSGKIVSIPRNDIVLEHVTFSYDGSEQNEVLHDVNLELPEESFTALVGPSGGGKSTIARLIARFWDVTGGNITIGGKNIKELSIHDSFLKSAHEFISGTMLVTGGFLMWFIHICLPLHCSLSHTVDNDVSMDISGFIVAIGVSNYQCLISGKHLLCKFQTDCLCSLSGKTVFCNIGWIVADNVVMTFDIFMFLIFVKMSICQFTFLVKRHRITVQSIHIKLFS